MGAGYTGMALLQALKARKDQVVVTTTRRERIASLTSEGCGTFLLGPSNEHAFQDLIDTSDAMVVLVAPGGCQTYEETYLKTARYIAAALAHRRTPFYLIYTSSTRVCEGCGSAVVHEETPLHPHSPQGKILLETEQLYLKSNATTCVLRLGGIYGPERTLDDRAERLAGLELSGTGEETTNHIHRDDIIAALLFCLDHALKGVYHLVNDAHPTRRELYSKICELRNLPLPRWKGSSSLERSGYEVSNQKIKSAGFVFKHPSIESLGNA